MRRIFAFFLKSITQYRYFLVRHNVVGLSMTYSYYYSVNPVNPWFSDNRPPRANLFGTGCRHNVLSYKHIKVYNIRQFCVTDWLLIS